MRWGGGGFKFLLWMAIPTHHFIDLQVHIFAGFQIYGLKNNNNKNTFIALHGKIPQTPVVCLSGTLSQSCSCYMSTLLYLFWLLVRLRVNKHTYFDYRYQLYTHTEKKEGRHRLNNVLTLIFKNPIFTQDTLANDGGSWCFAPSQPQRITSGLETNVNPCPTYSAKKSWNPKILQNSQN